jgi:hypothetical protein
MSAYEAPEYTPLRGSLLKAHPLTGASIGRCARKGPSLLSKRSRVFGKSLTGEESREAGTRCGSCEGVKVLNARMGSLQLPAFLQLTGSLLPAVFPLSESSHLLQIHASVEGMSFLCLGGALRTSFPPFLAGEA